MEHTESAQKKKSCPGPQRRISAATTASHCDDDLMTKHQAAHRFFQECLAEENGLAQGHEFAKYLAHDWGFHRDDPRFEKLYDDLMTDEHSYRTDMTLEDFIGVIVRSDQSVLLQKAFSGDLVVPEFPELREQIQDVFEEVYQEVSCEEGANASYIPQLGKVNPDLWGLSVCTIDGQRFDLGRSKTNFCAQSCIKPLTYCIALEEWGTEKIVQHVGREPSGVEFNSLTMNKNGIPHNPMINAGAIMSCSLVKPKLPLAERFEHLMTQLTRLTGGFEWGFNNSV
ncbi:MAG: hypothetical protein SGCHY_004955, partial [Lobulomycetales sp.]